MVKPLVLLQISDIHISILDDQPAKNLHYFCRNVLPNILTVHRKLILVLTGDIVDGTPPLFSFNSRHGQIPEEWSILATSIQPCLDLSLPIVSVRGNHDCFGVSTWDSIDNNGYREFYETLKRRNQKFFSKSIKMTWEYLGNQIYAVKESEKQLVLLDSCDGTGQTRLFHGRIKDDVTKRVYTELEPHANKKLVVFSHFPTGGYLSEDREVLLDLLVGRNISSYHSGHLHTDIGYPIVAITSNKFLEFQAPDFKSSQTIRLITGADGGDVFDLRPNSSGHWPDIASVEAAVGEVNSGTEITGMKLLIFRNFPEFHKWLGITLNLLGVLLSLAYYLAERTPFSFSHGICVSLIFILPLGFVQGVPDVYAWSLLYSVAVGFDLTMYENDTVYLLSSFNGFKVVLGTVLLLTIDRFCTWGKYLCILLYIPLMLTVYWVAMHINGIPGIIGVPLLIDINYLLHFLPYKLVK
jgi:Calcineurin-like phosphoesterase